MSGTWPSQFLYASCQRGAEMVLKQELAAGPLDLRPAFSRPGFVTCKLAQPPAHPEHLPLPTTFARSWGYGLGQVKGTQLRELADQVWESAAVQALLATENVADLHVWQRDTAMPGDKGFAPGPTPLAEAVEQALRAQAPLAHLQRMPAGAPRPPSRRNRWIVDVILVEPHQWWLGCHYTNRRHDCWPGGVWPQNLPPHAVSRAYLKMQEALAWSALPVARGDLCVDLGCAPGGTSQVLLEAGLHVLGVDPAEVDPVVKEHPHFQHVRRRTRDVPAKLTRGVRWVTADLNGTPSYTLDAVADLASRAENPVRGLILTLKFTDWKLAADIPQFVQRVRDWGYRDVRTRQLASNRQEICLVALRSRAQRRLRRPAGRTTRHDAPRVDQPPAPHFR